LGEGSPERGADPPEKRAGSPALAPPRGRETGHTLVWAERNGVGGREGDKADEWVPPEVVKMELRYKETWVWKKWI
jgi:hypothetical protein